MFLNVLLCFVLPFHASKYLYHVKVVGQVGKYLKPYVLKSCTESTVYNSWSNNWLFVFVFVCFLSCFWKFYKNLHWASKIYGPTQLNSKSHKCISTNYTKPLIRPLYKAYTPYCAVVLVSCTRVDKIIINAVDFTCKDIWNDWTKHYEKDYLR